MEVNLRFMTPDPFSYRPTTPCSHLCGRGDQVKGERRPTHVWSAWASTGQVHLGIYEAVSL